MISNASESPFVTSADRCVPMGRSFSVNFLHLDWIRDIHEQIDFSLSLYHWLSSFSFFLAISLKKLDVHVGKGIVFVIHTYSSIVLSVCPLRCLCSSCQVFGVCETNMHPHYCISLILVGFIWTVYMKEKINKRVVSIYLPFLLCLCVRIYLSVCVCVCVQLCLISALEWHLSVFFRSLPLPSTPCKLFFHFRSTSSGSLLSSR